MQIIQFETKCFCGYIKTLNGKSNWEMAMFLQREERLNIHC